MRKPLIILALLFAALWIIGYSVKGAVPFGFWKSGSDSLDQATLTWQSNIVAGGGSVSASTLAAANQFVVTAKASNYWDSLIIVCPVAGTNVTAATYYLKFPGTTNKATAAGTALSYNETGSLAGVWGNGTDGYWDTGYNPSGENNVTNFSLWAWPHSNSPAASSKTILGSYGSSAQVNSTLLGWLTGGTVETGTIAGVAGVEYVGSNVTGVAGAFIGVNVAVGRNATWYSNAIATGNVVAQSQGFHNGNLFFNAQNANGTAAAFGVRRTSFFVIAKGLSLVQITNLNNDVKTFQSALSRNP